MSWFFLIFLSVSQAAPSIERESADWTSLRAKALLNANTREQIVARLETIDLLKAARALCETQMRANKIPASCLSLIEREREAGFLGAKEAGVKRSKIENLCVRNLRRIRDLSDPGLQVKVPAGRCKDAVAEHIEKLRYGSEFRDPVEAFSSRHRF